MKGKTYGYLAKLDGETTRARSKHQESRIAKSLKGYTTINSGATLGQNDVISDFCEVEAKTTSKESYTLKLADWRMLRKKCDRRKMPIFMLDFEKSKDTLVIMTNDDFEHLLRLIESDK